MTSQKCVGVHALMHLCVETQLSRWNHSSGPVHLFDFSKIYLYFFNCVCFCEICACESVSTSQSTEKGITALELELHDVLRYLTSARDQTRVLCKSCVYS